MQLVTLVTAAIAGVSAVLAAPLMGGVTGCDVSTLSIAPYLKSANASLTPLDPPAPTDKLLTIVLGIGSQNYSCSAGVPVPNGAYAPLYDVSCLIKNDPSVAQYLTGLMVHVPPNVQTGAMALVQNFINAQITAGLHYFKGDFATPAFELTVASEKKQEKFYGAVFQKLAAPSGADTGKAPLNYGAVPYLKLMPKAGMGSTLSTIYRVDTAGGMQPTTCDWTGQKQIPYSALYYIYKSK
ncbi:hypothetical protein TWF694_005140 [Orbilia ellipsospora]|uniref:Malate dehydrogenase n=1 Tax=Orbilia ellipsospora TaxID=2528407 RepID=A0AAV9WUQ3_9PEZI